MTADKRRARAAALLLDLLREQGVAAEPGAKSFAVEVDGLRFELDVKVSRVAAPDLRKQLHAEVLAHLREYPWRAKRCGCSTSKRDRWAFSSKSRKICEKSGSRALVYARLEERWPTEPSNGKLPSGYVVHFVCPHHVDKLDAKSVVCVIELGESTMADVRRRAEQAEAAYWARREAETAAAAGDFQGPCGCFDTVPQCCPGRRVHALDGSCSLGRFPSQLPSGGVAPAKSRGAA